MPAEPSKPEIKARRASQSGGYSLCVAGRGNAAVEGLDRCREVAAGRSQAVCAVCGSSEALLLYLLSLNKLTMCGSSEGTMKAWTPRPPSAAAIAARMAATLASDGAFGAAAVGAAAPAAPAAADAMPACCMRLALLLGAGERRACRYWRAEQ